MHSDAMVRIMKARQKIAAKNTFFAGIIYNAKLVESTNSPIGVPTMWTNGVHIFFHPDFVRDNSAHIEGVFLHEVLHCALNHVARRQNRDPRNWNIACDWAVNPLCRGFSLPDEALYPPHDIGIHKGSAERMYRYLEEQQQESKDSGESEDSSESKGGATGEDGDGDDASDSSGNEQNQENQNPGGGNSDESDEPSSSSSSSESKETSKPEESASCPMQEPTPEELVEAEREWKRIVSRAKDAAEKAGDLPASMRRAIEELFPKEKMDWRTMIEDMAKHARSNRSGSWSKPNRRFAAQGYRMPGDMMDEVYRLIVCLDCSGSVSDDQHREMKAEVANLLDSRLITHATLMAVDTDVIATADAESSEDVAAFHCPNGGGTDFKSAMKQVAEIEDAVGCVFLTDMQTCDYGQDPGIPVIWVNWAPNSGHQAPNFGKVVPYQDVD